MSDWLIAKLLLLLVLLVLSGFFSGSEIALIGIGKLRARALLKRGVKGAERIDKLAGDPEAVVTTVSVWNNIVNIAASAVATSLAIDFFGRLHGVVIAIGVMTFLILTFGEILPKMVAAHQSERFSMIISKPIAFLVSITQPLTNVFSVITSAFEKQLLGMKWHRKKLMTEEEVETMLDIGEEEGAIEKDEKEMMKGVLRLDEIVVKHVMTPKEEMVCLEVNQSVDSAVELIKASGYTRIPVFKVTKDDIVGILYAKDLLITANKTTNKGNVSLRELMKRPHFVPETKRVDDLLDEFQRGKFHIAIVVDAAGRTKGLVCLEDLLEEIVGAIYDEYDIIKTSKKPRDFTRL